MILLINFEPQQNPYLNGSVEYEFWEMCVRRDIEAFIRADWSLTANDFDADGFLGIDANGSSNSCNWFPKYSSLFQYKKEFERQANEFSKKEFFEDPRDTLYRSLQISSPIITGERAVIVKTFDGKLTLGDGSFETLAWKSLFYLRNKDGRWLFTGFVGYLPLE